MSSKLLLQELSMHFLTKTELFDYWQIQQHRFQPPRGDCQDIEDMLEILQLYFHSLFPKLSIKQKIKFKKELIQALRDVRSAYLETASSDNLIQIINVCKTILEHLEN